MRVHNNNFKVRNKSVEILRENYNKIIRNKFLKICRK